MGSWFKTLTGFEEASARQVRENLSLDGEHLTSKVNGRSLRCGRLEMPTLRDLRLQASKLDKRGELKLSEKVGNVENLHQDPRNAGALFQVASQFNLLEMASPSRTPEHGVACYQHDHTQGPACAISAGAGTIFRNYFVKVGDHVGQTAEQQIDCLAELGAALGNERCELWRMQNGYVRATADGLTTVTERLAAMDDDERDRLQQLLRIGIQWDTEVTLGQLEHCVTQAYCSALPVSYNVHPKEMWTGFATLVLDAAYEATFCAAVINAARTGNNQLFLTLLGGGAFGNLEEWILGALRRAAERFREHDLEVFIVSYGSSDRGVQSLVRSFSEVP